MKITNIREAGSNNTLKWAISKGYKITDDAMLALITNETYYVVRFEDVNMLEAFRLIQLFREKVHIVRELPMAMPTAYNMETMFSGNIGDDKKPISELVSEMIQTYFIDLTKQMQVDDDIVNQSVIRMFMPMITRHFDIDIPISFTELIQNINSSDIPALFNSDYPNNIDSFWETHGADLKQYLSRIFVRYTSILKFNEAYTEVLRKVKYLPLKKVESDKLYRFKLSGFKKYNRVTREDVSCMMFNITKNELTTKMKILSSISSPLKTQFLVEMPIQYMMDIINTFDSEDLEVSYEIPMKLIIDSVDYILDHLESVGTFVTPVVMTTVENPEDTPPEELKFDNAVSAYKVRITEAVTALLKTIQILINESNNMESNIDLTGTFALIPSIFMTRAVFTIDYSKADLYLNHYNPAVREFFKEILDVTSGIRDEIGSI